MWWMWCVKHLYLLYATFYALGYFNLVFSSPSRSLPLDCLWQCVHIHWRGTAYGRPVWHNPSGVHDARPAARFPHLPSALPHDGTLGCRGSRTFSSFILDARPTALKSCQLLLSTEKPERHKAALGYVVGASNFSWGGFVSACTRHKIHQGRLLECPSNFPSLQLILTCLYLTEKGEGQLLPPSTHSQKQERDGRCSSAPPCPQSSECTTCTHTSMIFSVICSCCHGAPSVSSLSGWAEAVHDVYYRQHP